MAKTAILVDGGFYRKQAKYLFAEKDPQLRADELFEYCCRHLNDPKHKYETQHRELYRIFYYDCPPSEKTLFNPLTGRANDLGKSDKYKWAKEFFSSLASKRKVALRMGELLDTNAKYELRPEALKKLLRKEITVEDLTDADFSLNIQQKGVDMRIGLDIASLAHKGLVDQIVLISGDSDFVPAAKYARREGIDFILDPMYHTVRESLNLHIDGLSTRTKRPPENVNDSLHISRISLCSCTLDDK